MNAHHILAGSALILTSAWAVAQDAPESLLPPGFDRPAPRRDGGRDAPRDVARTPVTTASGTPSVISGPVVQPIGQVARGPVRSAPVVLPPGVPSLEALEGMSPEQLDDVLGLKPKDDIPLAARRALRQVGMIDESEGGLPHWSLRQQDAGLVGAAIQGNSGRLVSRWGHILLRRALASRLDAPAGLNPADFAAMRSALLVRMGEGAAARYIAQDVDTANYSPALTRAAFDAYVATSDFTGLCPAIALKGVDAKDKPGQVMQAICEAFAGDSSRSMASLDRLTYYGAMPRIDMLLAQKYAGAAGKARRAVTIEWNLVKDMTPWRYGMTLAVGLQPPADLMKGVSPSYAYMAATAPMLAVDSRANAADVAAGRGILSASAMVDLYGQIYDLDGNEGEWAARAGKLRDAYTAQLPADRLAALKDLWGNGSDPLQLYSRQVLTAYAAARLPVDPAFADDAGSLIASMLAAGLDANALRWSGVVAKGSEGWALLALASSNQAGVDTGLVDDFHGNDESAGQRKSHFLVAGLAGLGRLSLGDASGLAGKYGFRLDHPSRWSQLIDKAAEVRNPALVALLAGLGMQGDGWDGMTPRNLYHIVAALNRVGMVAEARMIAAEAVARG